MFEFILQFLTTDRVVDQEKISYAPTMNKASIQIQGKPGGTPLLRVQQGVWFGQALAADDCAYVIGQYTQIDGALDTDLFIRATQLVVSETQTLRLRFEEADGSLVQHVVELADWAPLVLYFSDQPDPEAAAQSWVSGRLRTPFDVARSPLFSWALIRLGEDRHRWVQIYHHLILDGRAGAVLQRRVADVYGELVAGHRPGAVDYVPVDELAREETDYRDSARWLKDRDYWRGLLSDRPDPVRLAETLLPAPPAFLRESFELSAPLSDALRVRARAAGVSVPNLVMAAVAIYVHRLTGKRDIMISAPLLGRTGRRVRNTPAMLANAMPMRFQLHPSENVADVLQQAKRQQNAALRHQQFSQDDLRDALSMGPQDDQLAPISVNSMPFDVAQRLGSCSSTTHNLSNGPVPDISFISYEDHPGMGIAFDVDANGQYYSRDALCRHAKRFERLLSSMASSPNAAVGSLDLLDADERDLVVEGFNATDHVLEGPETL
ncbi:MAG: condensation domain-containing protein, partial [Alphaproteobacteria bacterium]|nr:condensation domain-containing protein [Alphaproteobacteria bacterium]